MITFFGRVSMNKTASATSFGSRRAPDARSASSFSLGQSLMSGVATGPGRTAPTRTVCFAT